jgi:hypothetical protein
MKICPKYKSCIIFQGESAASENSEEIFRNLFCKAGAEKYTKCLRYIVSEKVGIAPPSSIYPNSQLSPEEVVDLMKEMGLL